MTAMFITHSTFLSEVLLPQLCTKKLYNLAQLSTAIIVSLYNDYFKIMKLNQQCSMSWVKSLLLNHPTLYKDNYHYMVSIELSNLRTLDNSMMHHHTFYKGNCNFQLNWSKKVQQPLHFEVFEIGQFCLFDSNDNCEKLHPNFENVRLCQSWSYKVTDRSNFCRSVVKWIAIRLENCNCMQF